MSPRTIFEADLVKLHEEVKKMSLTVEQTYDDLFTAVEEKDDQVIQKIMKRDLVINHMKQSIEADCLSLITKQQPVARDLRMISAALKVVTDIERIGDHCVDIAELIYRMKMEDLSQYCVHINELIKKTMEAVHKSVDAFINRDMEAAKTVIKDDDVIDHLFNEVKKELSEYMSKDNQQMDICVDTLMIAKYLEKIGDHAENIAEWEIFQETGIMKETRLL